MVFELYGSLLEFMIAAQGNFDYFAIELSAQQYQGDIKSKRQPKRGYIKYEIATTSSVSFIHDRLRAELRRRYDEYWKLQRKIFIFD